MAAIGGFRSDLSIMRKIDGNFGNVSAGVLFSKVAYRSFSLSRNKKINRKPFSRSSQEIVILLKINKGDTSRSFRSVRSPKPQIFVEMFRRNLQSSVWKLHVGAHQAPVVRKVDNAIHWMNHYPVDSVVCFANSYPLDSDLSGG